MTLAKVLILNIRFLTLGFFRMFSVIDIISTVHLSKKLSDQNSQKYVLTACRFAMQVTPLISSITLITIPTLFRMSVTRDLTYKL